MATNYMMGAPDERIMNFEHTFRWTDTDKAILDKLQSWIPDKIFDAHCHLLHTDWYPKGYNLLQAYGISDAKRTLEDQKELYGNRKFRALLLATPAPAFTKNVPMRNEMNKWMNDQMEFAPDCVGTIYVMSQDTKEQIEAMITHPNIRGFKCYHQSAITEGETWYATVDQYLPEAAWEVANERGMSITIHMVRPDALSDEKNLNYFIEKTAQYPNAKLILAHCARSFATWTNLEPLKKTRGIPNLYYDMGAITDPACIAYLIKMAGADHVMWATDYAIDRAHGKAINCAESFNWIYECDLPEGVHFEMAKTCLEALLAFYQASLMLDMSREDIEKVFYYTACDLYGLKDE